MTRTVSHPKVIVSRLQMLPAKSATVHTIDRRKLWERTAGDVVDDGSTDFDDDLVRLIESCLLRGACYQEPN